MPRNRHVSDEKFVASDLDDHDESLEKHVMVRKEMAQR
jgi:hypothetical protein